MVDNVFCIIGLVFILNILIYGSFYSWILFSIYV